MDLQRLAFGVMYRLGFTPWDGHRLPSALTEMVEGEQAVSPGKALDIGCGTGDMSIYLAKHKWDVTAMDFVDAALDRARAKTDSAGVKVHYLRADVTKLSESQVGTGFDLILDGGCLHGLTDPQRQAYVREVSGVARTGTRLILLGFAEGKRRGPTGFNQPEVERRFASGWRLLSAVVTDLSTEPDSPIHCYVLERT
ncbi:MAG: class I SAM-dependent methyltransferase [Acidobacteriota bacterium]